MVLRILSIAGESPHKITNGYCLRINKLLTTAARLPATEVHCFAPVTKSNLADASNWAISENIHFHGVQLEGEMQYDPDLRAIFKKECSVRVEKMLEGDSLVVLHGLVPIVDFADRDFATSAIADMIDEIEPLIKKDIKNHFIKRRLKEALRAVRNLWLYRRETMHLLSRFEHILLVAHDDAERLRKALRQKSICVIPNGVDFPENSSRNSSNKPPVVFFHGVYGYGPNEEAALFLIGEVAPLLGEAFPACRIVLAGRNPTRRMVQAGKMHANVHIAGEVDDMSEYLLSAAVGAYPIFTRAGLQNKILEAWSHGLPIVTTPGIIAMFEAFSTDVGKCARTASSAEEFAERIGELLEDAEACEQLSARSRHFVQNHFTWQGAVRQLLQLGSGVGG